jgi:hypothetical protein
MAAATALRATDGAIGRAVRPRSAALTAILAITIAGCVSPKPVEVAQPAASSTAAKPSGIADARSAHITALEQQLRQAESLFRSSNRGAAEGIFNGVIEDHDFNALPPEYQHLALRAAAFSASQEGQLDRAHDLIKRSCDTVGADQYDWLLRFQIAAARRDDSDRIRSLSQLAQSWPQSLNRVTYELVQRTVFVARSEPDQQLMLLQALFAAKYIPYTGVEPSGLWHTLALLQLQHGDQAGAIATSEHITDPTVLISLVVDDRFAAVRAKLPSMINFDAAKATDEEISRWRMAVERNPDRLYPMIQLTYQLLGTAQFDEALQRTDEIIARLKAEPAGTDVYKDQKQEYVWVLNLRADALTGLSRPDEAVQQLEEASRLSESGRPNINQTINLAELYNNLGRPMDARAALKRLDPNSASPYGRMQLELNDFLAALQVSDSGEIDRALAYMQQHQGDAISSYQIALVESGRKADAQKLLLTRLQDSQQRQEALLAVQNYTQFKQLRRVMERRALWRSLIESPTVQEAARKAGTITQFDVDGPHRY